VSGQPRQEKGWSIASIWLEINSDDLWSRNRNLGQQSENPGFLPSKVFGWSPTPSGGFDRHLIASDISPQDKSMMLSLPVLDGDGVRRSEP
jgi:hypothetical protein